MGSVFNRYEKLHHSVENLSEEVLLEGAEKLKLPPPMARMLSYLGQLKAADRVPVMKLMADLDLIYNTNTMYLQTLAAQGHVLIEKRGAVNTARLADLPPAQLIALVPEWEDRFGIHPYAQATEQQRRRAKYANK